MIVQSQVVKILTNLEEDTKLNGKGEGGVMTWTGFYTLELSIVQDFKGGHNIRVTGRRAHDKDSGRDVTDGKTNVREV